MLEWKKRARRETTDAADRRVLETRCGGYRVVESKSLFGLPVVIYAMIRGNCMWDIISRHRKLGAAKTACERHARSRSGDGLVRKRADRRKVRRRNAVSSRVTSA